MRQQQRGGDELLSTQSLPSPSVITRTSSSSSRTREASSRENLIFRLLFPKEGRKDCRRAQRRRASAMRKQRHFCSTSNTPSFEDGEERVGKLQIATAPSCCTPDPLYLSLSLSLFFGAALRDSFNNNPGMMSVFGFCTALHGQKEGQKGRRVRCKGLSSPLSCRVCVSRLVSPAWRSRWLRDPPSPVPHARWSGR